MTLLSYVVYSDFDTLPLVEEASSRAWEALEEELLQVIGKHK